MNSPAVALPTDAVLLLGPTGAGKSPLGDLIASCGFLGKRSHHLDFGSELRSIASGVCASFFSPVEQDFIRGVLEHGLLLENDRFSLVRKIFTYFLVRSRFCSGDILFLNGIPRHEGQAFDVSSIAKVHALVVLECSAASVFCRIEKNTGGDRSGRDDDRLQLIEKKLRLFFERTAPLIDHYSRAGSRLYRIAVNERTTTVSVYHRLSLLAAADPPFSLITEPPQR